MDGSENKLTPNNVLSANSNELESLANTEVNTAKAQMKMFIIAQAKTQLQKVIQLNDKLDSWTNTYTRRVDEEIENNPDISPSDIAKYMEQITSMIDRSFNMIKEVSSDEKLLNLMYMDMSQNITMNSANSNTLEDDNINQKFDVRSRAKIRNAVSEVLNYINSTEDNTIEVTPEDVK